MGLVSATISTVAADKRTGRCKVDLIRQTRAEELLKIDEPTSTIGATG